MHTKARFRNVLFDPSLHPGSAAMAILLMLLFFLFLLLFMTFTAQPAEGQSCEVLYSFDSGQARGLPGSMHCRLREAKGQLGTITSSAF